MATDEEVQKKIESVNELRLKIRDAQDGVAAAQVENANDVQMKLLEREEERLKAELAQLESQAKVDTEAQVEALVSGPEEPNLEVQTASAEEKE